MALEVLKTGGRPSQEVAEEMAVRIKALIHEYDDRTPVALAIGVLEIVKAELAADHR